MARNSSYKDKKPPKVFLPVLAGLFVPVVAYIVYMSYNPLVVGRDSNSAVYGLWIVDNIIFPVLSVLLFLIQWLVILPWWNKVIVGKKWRAAFILIGICLLFGLGMGYITWMPAFGLTRLVLSVAFVFFVQLIYWALNILVLYIIDKPRILKLRSGK